MYRLIDGKKLADEIIAEVRAQIIEKKLEPHLAIILVGTDPASELYVKLKSQAAKKAGIELHLYRIDEDASEQSILETIAFLNTDQEIDAILIQLPLPKKFDQQKILDALDYRKDVDGFHKKNIASFLAGKPQHILPGLSFGIWKLIESTGPEHYKHKSALVISKSDEFSLPLMELLRQKGLTATTVKPSDARLIELSQKADILISAVGIPKSITRDMVKDGAILIDVGINKIKGKTVGDVDFANVAPKTSFITPVPGGVGPMTVAMLLYNTLRLAAERKK
ncbi:MAG: bifunctional 5,10-methylenetetrahydrofolate dehydrogenase/5,10-methenyltetrahydrofolate cyclohydrolase [Candidatus Komeilibacteria bacterium]|nr:bifunctional 5,10-methylenetetrahydrofolate dehydrogenase/5,10-methenyltetrahydrofolate cyclohydrolase [Candidatus Komeilibacteria bacterium]